jgi:tetratricopeptide (TPR) repeat protein
MMKEPTSNFLDPKLKERVDDYVSGRLSQAEIDQLWEDLIQDPEALSYLKTVANLKQVAEQWNDEPARIEQKSRNVKEPKVWYWAIAALFMVASLFGLYQYSATADELSPIDRIELDYYRSSAELPDRLDDSAAVQEAIMVANRGEYPRALEMLEQALEYAEDPMQRAVIYLNSGSILYNQSSYSEAADKFLKIVEIEQLQDEMLEERAWWYLGNAYFQMNRFEEAKEAFTQAYELNGAYRRVTERYIAAMPV